MSCYIAAPFFNRPQLELAETIENILLEERVPFYSPRKSGVLKPAASSEDRRRILLSNIDAIQTASVVLAVMDWLLPPEHYLHVIERGEDSWHFKSPDLNLPDTGTVWECGFAYAIHRPIIGYVSKAKKINVMIAETFKGVVGSPEELRGFARTWSGASFSYDNLKPWTGSIQ
jgi:nucleoside 2-deoxyribosyltransferase